MIDAIRGEFTHEAGVTRRLLERVPDDKLGWQPHERSMTLARLAGHIAKLPHWSTGIFTTDEMDLATIPDSERIAIPTSRAEVLALHDTTTAEFEAATRDVPDSRLFEPWRLRRGERVLFEMPRAFALRGFVLNHVIHHRGQLSVFLRLLDVPLPPIYGPTADDRIGFS
jgi:uncharacterized damage-inducible protein DinB